MATWRKASSDTIKQGLEKKKLGESVCEGERDADRHIIRHAAKKADGETWTSRQSQVNVRDFLLLLHSLWGNQWGFPFMI